MGSVVLFLHSRYKTDYCRKLFCQCYIIVVLIFAGVNQLVVVVNKMDNVSWSQQRFDEICHKLGSFLHQVGFKDADLCYVPCSGLNGMNLTEKLNDSSATWFKGPTLIDGIGNLIFDRGTFIVRTPII